MNSQYAGAFAAEDADGVHDEPPEDHEPKVKKPKKGANSKAKKLKSKPGSQKTGFKEVENLEEQGRFPKNGGRDGGPGPGLDRSLRAESLW